MAVPADSAAKRLRSPGQERHSAGQSISRGISETHQRSRDRANVPQHGDRESGTKAAHQARWANVLSSASLERIRIDAPSFKRSSRRARRKVILKSPDTLYVFVLLESPFPTTASLVAPAFGGEIKCVSRDGKRP